MMLGFVIALLSNSAQDSNITEHLGAPLPLATVWRNTDDNAIRLGDVVTDRRPTLLVLHYFACPMLCSMVLEGLGHALDALPLQAGRDYNVLSVSFDPNDTVASARTRQETTLSKHRIAPWPFLTGPQASISELLRALGVHLWRDPVSGDYAHPAALFVIAPDGTIAQYVYGVRFTPEELEQALQRARDGSVTSTLQRVFLRCFAYHPAARRFAPLLATVMRVGGVAILGTLILGLWRLQRRAAP